MIAVLGLYRQLTSLFIRFDPMIPRVRLPLGLKWARTLVGPICNPSRRTQPPKWISTWPNSTPVYFGPNSDKIFLILGNILNLFLCYRYLYIYGWWYSFFGRCANDEPFAPTYQVSKERAKSLGINYIPLDVSLKETVESLKEKNFVSF